MIKDLEISDILKAVNSISKINKKKANATDAKINLNNKGNVLNLNNKARSNKKIFLFSIK